MSERKKTSIKMLLSNSQTGSLIGTGGSAIKSLMAQTGAKILVSGNTEHYPGTSDRVVLISGQRDAVVLAETLIWEMIAQLSSAEDERQVQWDPELAFNSLGENNTVDVSCKVTIPASAGGLILGRGGANIRAIAEESGAKLSMTSKDQAIFTQERVLTISGRASSCVKCTELVVIKLDENDDVAAFVNRGTTYAAPMSAYGALNMGLASPYGVFGGAVGAGGRTSRGSRGGGHSHDAGQSQLLNSLVGSAASSTPSAAETTITLAVPNDLIGNILGRQGATIREIISLSGAKVLVSGRDEFVEGTTNRLVTISGSPSCAQTAHMFITQRLQNPTPNPTKRSSYEPRVSV